MGEIVRIHHLCVQTNDIVKSMKFYCENLGFCLLSRETCGFGEYAMLRLGSSNLELIQPRSSDEGNFGSCRPIAHMGLLVQSIDEVYDMLTQRGVSFVSGEVGEFSEPMGGFRSLSLLGPSGEAINLYEFSHSF